MEVVFDRVIGLRRGDDVVVRGMSVGRVRALALTPGGVRVVCDLTSRVHLRQNYRIWIVSASMVGGRYLELDEGSPDAPPVPPRTVLRGEKPYDLFDEATTAVRDIRRALQEGGVLTNLQAAAGSLRAVADGIRRGEGTVGRLLADESVYADLKSVVQDVRSAANDVKAIAERLGKGEGTVGRLLADDTVFTQLKEAVASLKQVGERLSSGEGTVGKLLAGDDTLYQDARQAVASLKEIVARVERGEGVLGKLARDPALYEDIRSTVNEARAAIDDYRETSPVVTFISLLFGATGF
jgi:phospholipid/cholesterol/gamma-HCH transport system substrate-binding protein